VACFPGLDTPQQNGAIVPLADAVEQMHLDLVRALLHAKARRSSKTLEQVVSQLRRINSQTHSRQHFSDRLATFSGGSPSRGNANSWRFPHREAGRTRVTSSGEESDTFLG
jgi:hypothetical protein